MRDKYFITGSQGHLGNNLIRMLLKKKKKLKAMTRNDFNYFSAKLSKNPNLEVVYGDLLVKNSLKNILRDVKTIFHTAFPIKAGGNKNSKDIIMSAVKGTENLLKEAKKQGVEKVVFVSSICTLGNSSLKNQPLNENNWNKNPIHPYIKAKIKSEKVALRLAKKYNLWLISILPGTMVGPNCFRLTPIMRILDQILKKKVNFDINFPFSIVNVEDVAKGMCLAEKKGKNLNRYILTNEKVITYSELIQIIGTGRKVKIGKTILKLLAYLDVLKYKLFKIAPTIIPETIDNFYNQKMYCDISKAKRELGWNPRPIRKALNKAVTWLDQNNSDT